SRTPDNIQLMGSDDWSRDVNDKLQQLTTKPRKDAVKCFEMVASVSKDFFLDPTTGKPDPKLVRDWGEKTLEHLQKRFPNQITSAAIHMDEETPHMHIFAVPIIEKDVKAKGRPKKGKTKDREAKRQVALSYRDVLGGKSDEAAKKLSQLQQDYQDFLQQTYPEKGVQDRQSANEAPEKPRHVSHKEWAIEMRKKAQQIESAKEVSDAAHVLLDATKNDEIHPVRDPKRGRRWETGPQMKEARRPTIIDALKKARDVAWEPCRQLYQHMLAIRKDLSDRLGENEDASERDRQARLRENERLAALDLQQRMDKNAQTYEKQEKQLAETEKRIEKVAKALPVAESKALRLEQAKARQVHQRGRTGDER
ncbi:plasmid recombination protein, partial [Komagataeibacter sp. FNDCF1]|uniref:plasmid recombination protein n=1 Tax=Komagataeibacter sp. FNDCF1 TaxID=2878681 RepID=UPI001E4549EC